MQFRRWSGDLNVPDPVAISLDNFGRAYVTQTQRRKSQDLDIRANRDWIAADVGLQSVEQKRSFYHWALAPDSDDPRNSARVADLNADGLHDYRDLTVLSERIHLIEDQDGDGTADQMSLFAEDFNTEVTGIAAGVLWHEGNVYATIAPDVWRLADRDGDGKADQRRHIATGFGIHIAYAGHDMHGLTVGPDGRLYWTIGDKGISIRSLSGERFHYPNQGGVLRCNPDGTNLEVFAHGLRNVQEIAFDQFGNLFGVDNDADTQGERERFVAIVRDMDAGWRCHYQYRGELYNPWTAERLWQTHFAGQAAYIVPPIQYSIDGPAGFAFNPGTALNEQYHNYFFLTGAPAGKQIAFRVEPHGDTFAVIDEHEIGNGIPLVGINFGPDGGLYGVDWGGGYPLTQTGAVWCIDDPSAAGNSRRAEVSRLLREGVGHRATGELADQLQHADQRVRLAAQFELVRRVDDVTLSEILDGSEHVLPRLHAIWGLGQLIRDGRDVDLQVLAAALADDHPQIRRQAIVALTESSQFDSSLLSPRVLDDSPVVALEALLSVARHPYSGLLDDLLECAKSIETDQVYLRHGLSTALTAIADQDLAALSHYENRLVRLCAVVALRRKQSSAIAAFLNDQDEGVRTEAARAIYDDFSIDAAMPSLAAALSDSKSESAAEVMRMLGANARLAGGANAHRLLNYASQSANKREFRVEAIRCLQDWNAPPELDRVTGRYRHARRPATLSKAELQPILLSLTTDKEDQVREAAINTMTALNWQLEPDTLVELIASSDSASLTIAALDALESDPELHRKAIETALSRSLVPLQIHALRALTSTDPAQATLWAKAMLRTDTAIPIRQAAIVTFGSVDTAEAELELLDLYRRYQIGELSSALWLELFEAGENWERRSDSIAELVELTSTRRNDAAQEDVVAGYADCLEGGNLIRGEAIFLNHVSAQCVRCHQVGGQGSQVGPPLDGIALKRSPSHLLRSIIDPSAEIEPAFQSVSALLFSGQVITGVKVSENEATVTIVDERGESSRIEKDEIDEILVQRKSTMPEMTEQLTRREIRDLVAYLLSLRSQ